MKKNTVVTIAAVLLSLSFSVLYFALFAWIREAPASAETVVQQPTSAPLQSEEPVSAQTAADSSTLTWIQAGAFATESSLNELMAFLQQDGFDPVSYPRGELTLVAVGVSLDRQQTEQVRQRMIELDYEWMEKSASLTQQQKQQFLQGQISEVLEACASQP